MQAGKIAHWDRLQFKVAVQNAIVLTNVLPFTYRYRANLESFSADSASTVVSAVRLYAERSGVLDGINNQQHAGLHAELYGTVLYSESALTDTSNPWIAMTFHNLRIYAKRVDGRFFWEARADQIQVETHSGIVQTIADWLYQSPSSADYFTPASLPVLGLPPTLEARTSNYFGTLVVPNTDNQLISFEAIGGWRFRETSTSDWQSLPVELQTAESGTAGCCAFTASKPAMTAVSTWDAKIVPTGKHQHSVLTGTSFLEYAHGEVTLLPSLPRRWQFLPGSHANQILIHRFPFPETGYQDHTICHSVSSSGQETCFLDSTTQSSVYASRSTTLLSWSANVAESNLLYAPYHYRYVKEVYPAGSNTIWFDKRSTEIRYPICDSNMLSYYQHSLDLVRYLNSWSNPHWSHFLYFTDWSLGVPLQPVAHTSYWLPHQQQYLDHDQLPAEQRTKRRNQLLPEPLTDSTYRNLVSTQLAGYATLWAGIVRYDPHQFPLVTEQTLDSTSAPRWTAQNATITFGAQISVIPTATTSTLEFDLTDFSTHAYLYTAIADSVRVVISGTYTSIAVEMLNAAGDVVALQSVQGDSTRYRYATSGDTVYAGSWSQGYQADLATYTETPVDLQANGVSSSTMSDASRRTLWELFGAMSGAKLRITVTQDTTSDYQLNYPTFYRDSTRTTKAYPETAHAAAITDQDHLWRFGGLEFQLANPVPTLRVVHSSSSVYDYFAIRNLLYRAQPWQDQMASDAAQIYDSIEFSAIGDLRSDTRVWMEPFRERALPTGILINAYREVPPLVVFPRRERNADHVETGEWTQTSYLLAPVYRYYCSAGQPLHLDRVLYSGGGTELSRERLTDLAESFGRFAITKQAILLTNEEVITNWSGQTIHTPRFLLSGQNIDFARATPFHGYSAILPVKAPFPAGTADLAIDGRRQWLLFAESDQLQVYHLVPFSSWSQRTYDRVIVKLAYDSRSGWYLIADSDGTTVKVYRSGDAGESIEERLNMTTDSIAIETISPFGVWVVLYRDPADNLVKRRESTDLGATWTAGAAIDLDGAPLNGKPVSLRYDARTQSLLLAFQRPDNSFGVARSGDLGISWTTVVV